LIVRSSPQTRFTQKSSQLFSYRFRLDLRIKSNGRLVFRLLFRECLHAYGFFLL